MKKWMYHSEKVVLVAAILIFLALSANAQFQMGNTLAPLTGTTYPIIYANDAKGGHHQVPDIATRNTITSLRRQVGMLCTVLNDGTGSPKTYQLICADTKVARDDNTSWVVFAPGGGGNTGDVTLATGQSYLTITGQTITAGLVDLASSTKGLLSASSVPDITGDVVIVAGTLRTDIKSTAVTYDKMQRLSTHNLLLGSDATGATTAVSEISLGSNLSMTGNTLNAAGTGTNTGDETQATIKTKLGSATGSADGYITTADWTLFNDKASTVSPIFTGIPTAPTVLLPNNSDQIATTAFVNQAVSTAATPDATDLIKGKILLKGDLAGSADAPVIAVSAITTDKILDGTIADVDLNKANIPLSGFANALADVSMGNAGTNFKILNLAPPVSATDAATKGYVDAGIAADGKLYQGNATDMTAFSALTWALVSGGADLGHSIPSPICIMDQSLYTWIAFPSAWGNQSFFYQYGGISYSVIDGLQKRVIKAADTGSVDYQIWFFNTKPNTAVSLIANNN